MLRWQMADGRWQSAPVTAKRRELAGAANTSRVAGRAEPAHHGAARSESVRGRIRFWPSAICHLPSLSFGLLARAALAAFRDVVRLFEHALEKRRARRLSAAFLGGLGEFKI